ncbi:hypothetical protein Tco_1251706 [Tanacetum coccineum]
MDLYHSRLTQDDLNDLIIKYKIPRDLHPRLPSEEFVMSELSGNAIGFSRLGANKAIPDAMVWRHLDVAIDDLRPTVGSFNMADVRRLSTHVVKLRDMLKGMLVLSGLSPVWKSRIYDPEEPHLDVRPTLQRLPFYCTPPVAADVVIPEPAPEDLVVGTPSSKIIAKAEASQKRKDSTSGADSSRVAKRTRYALAQSSGSTTRSNLFVGDFDDESDGDDDACVEIPLALTPEGKGIMLDDVVAPSGGVSRPRSSSGPASSFRDVSGDAIHTDFFPFSNGPDYATYPEDGVARNCEFTREE